MKKEKQQSLFSVVADADRHVTQHHEVNLKIVLAKILEQNTEIKEVDWCTKIFKYVNLCYLKKL